MATHIASSDEQLVGEELVGEQLDPAAVALLAELTSTAQVSAQGDDSLDTEPRRTGGRRLTDDDELSHRLNRHVLPSLRSRASSLGYLSVGHLARAVLDLQGSAPHLAHVRAHVGTLDVPIVAGGALRGPRSNPPWAIDEARRLFRDLIQTRPDEALVVRRLGYADIPLTAATRAFLVEAWLGHTLSRDDEAALAATVAAEVDRVGADASRWSAEARQARETLVLDNLWLCARTARLYAGRGMEIDDLLQSAVEGVLRAVPKFDPDRGVRFMSYAASWVFQSITRAIGDGSRLIRLPVHLHEQGSRVDAAHDRSWAALLREPTLAEIAAEAAVPHAVVHAHLVTSRPVSLDDPRHAELVRDLPSPDEPLAAVVESVDLRRTLDELLSGLPERQRTVLERRVGLSSETPETLDAIGQDFDVTRERIRQIEEKALKTLRHPSRANRLRDYSAVELHTVELVSQALVATVMGDIEPNERPIAVALWGLGDARRQSVKAAARHFAVPQQDIVAVIGRVVSLARARAEAASVQHEAALARQPSVALPDQEHADLFDLRLVHPGWSSPWALPDEAELPEPTAIADPSHSRTEIVQQLALPSPPAATRSGAPAGAATAAPRASATRPNSVEVRPLAGLPSIGGATPAEVSTLRAELSLRAWQIAASLWDLDGRRYRTLREVAGDHLVSMTHVREVARAVVAMAGERRARPSVPTQGGDSTDRPSSEATGIVPPAAPKGALLKDALDPSAWSAVVAVVAALRHSHPGDHRAAVLRTGVDGSRPRTQRATARQTGRSTSSIFLVERMILRNIDRRHVSVSIQDYWDRIETGRAAIDS